MTFVDGRWDGSDGCNAVGARWALDEGAHLVSAADVGITMMGCEGDPTAIELTGAERLGFDGDVLVLLDASGAELGRLERP